MTVMFSDFTMGSTPRLTDIVVGLRGNVNEQFNYNGVADNLGNIIISYSPPIGPGVPVNYLNVTSGFTGNAAVLGTLGSDTNVDLDISLQGLGNVHILGTGALYLPAGTTAQEPTPTIGGIRYNTTTNFLEYSDGAAWATLSSGSGFTGTLPIQVVGSVISLQTPLTVQYGGIGNSSVTAYAPLVGGTTTTSPLQSVSTAGASAGYVLTFNGTGALPTWQVAAGTGTVVPGLINQLAWYEFTGNSVYGLPIANNGALITSAGGVPSISSTLPIAVQLNITETGVISVGTWNAGVIGAIYGGTSQSSYALGDTLYSSAANVLSKLPGNITAVKQYLSQTGTGAVSAAPVWATISGADITGAALTEVNDTNVTLTLGGTPATALLRAASLTLGWTGTLSTTRGGLGLSNPTAHGILVGEGAAAVTPIVLTSGQLLIGSTGVDPVAASLTAGTAIQISNSAGAISITNTGVTSLVATANQTTVSSATGAVTIGIANNPILPGTGGVTLPSGSTAARAGAAGTIRFNSQTSVVELTVDGTTWATVETSATGVLSVSGTANRITSTGGINPVIDISAAYVGQTSIVTLGTISTATWNASTIGAIYGGTGQNTYTLGDTLYSSATNVLSKLAGNITTAKQYLSQTGTGAVSAAPAWATISGADITGFPLTEVNDTNVTLTLGGSPATALLNATSLTLGWTGTLSPTRGGLGLSNPTAHGILVGEGAAAVNPIILSSGQLLIGSTGVDPVAAGLTAGTAIQVVTGAGTITLNNTGVTSLIATANQTTVSSATGAVTIGLANNPILPGTGGVTLPSGSTATRAGAAGTIRFNSQTSVVELTVDGATWSTVETAATGVTSVSGTLNRITSTGGTTPVIDISAAYVGQTSITTLGTITTATWNASTIGAIYGGTGQNTYALGDTLYSSAMNVLSKLAGNITTAKQYLSQTGTGAVSAAPVWATISGGDITGAALTEVNDTNVTLTLGGSPSTALLNATSLTLGWSGTLALTRGGLGASLSANNGGIFYSTGSAGAILNGTSTANQILMSGSNSAPIWSTAVYPATVTATSILYTTSANNISSLPSVASAVVIGNGVGNIAFSSAMNNGQLLIGSTGATPAVANLSAGTGITITNGAGTIQIASNGSPMTVVNQTTASVTMTTNTVYICNAGSLITFTLPATANIGDTLEINGNSASGWTIAQNAGQTLHLNSTSSTTGAGGSMSSTQRYNCVKLRCVTANTDFVVSYSSGNLNLV